jgi:microcystin-dependent protein
MYKGFGFLALDESKIYFKNSSATGDWSIGLYFGKGDGIVSTVFTSTTHPSGLAGQSGATDTYTINYSNLETDTFIVKNGEDGLDNIIDTVIGVETTWSSTKIKNLLAQKADKAELDQRIDSLDSTTVKLTGNQTIDGVKTFSSNIVGNITGNAGTATKLSTARTINGVVFDGTADITIPSIPTGGIIMWSGSIVSIPTGWALCDGANGTPDLRDRFVVGAGSSYSVGATGGSKDAVVVSHTHTGTANSGGGGESVVTGYSSGNPIGFPYIEGGTKQLIYASTSAHMHSLIINSTGSSGTNANLPPYYALAYIMKK